MSPQQMVDKSIELAFKHASSTAQIENSLDELAELDGIASIKNNTLRKKVRNEVLQEMTSKKKFSAHTEHMIRAFVNNMDDVLRPRYLTPTTKKMLRQRFG